MNNIDLVIAKYKENINWLSNIAQIKTIKNIFIYQKFPEDIPLISHKYQIASLPNFGRESNTYLYHIVHNYDDLNEYTVFLQGNPFPHTTNLVNKLRDITPNSIQTIMPLNSIEIENEYHRYRYHPSHPHGLFLAYFMDLLFDITLDKNQTVEVCYGAQFCVSRETIQSRPRKFYEYLLKIVSRKPNGIEPYIFERLWLYIFNPNIPISDTYKNWL